MWFVPRAELISRNLVRLVIHLASTTDTRVGVHIGGYGLLGISTLLMVRGRVTKLNLGALSLLTE